MQPVEKPLPAIPTRATHQEVLFSGPMPPPEALRAYEELIPGAGERILTIFEEQVRQRHLQENRALDAEIRLSMRGQLFAFIIVSGGLVLSELFGLTGREGSAIATFITSVVALSGLFIYGNRKSSTS